MLSEKQKEILEAKANELGLRKLQGRLISNSKYESDSARRIKIAEALQYLLELNAVEEPKLSSHVDDGNKGKLPRKSSPLFLKITFLSMILLVAYFLVTNPIISYFSTIGMKSISLFYEAIYFILRMIAIISIGVPVIFLTQIGLRLLFKDSSLIKLFWALIVCITIIMSYYGFIGSLVTTEETNIGFFEKYSGYSELKNMLAYINIGFQIGILLFLIVYYLMPMIVSSTIEKMLISFLMIFASVAGLIPVAGDAINFMLQTSCLIIIMISPITRNFKKAMNALEENGFEFVLQKISFLKQQIFIR